MFVGIGYFLSILILLLLLKSQICNCKIELYFNCLLAQDSLLSILLSLLLLKSQI